MAAKLIRAKEMALEIDPEFYRSLWINSHEACPDWMPPPDEAAADSYLGNGFFPTWCLDVVHRQLIQAARDPRFAFGETILTVWPPPPNFAGINAVTRVIHVDDNGDGRGDRTVTVPMPIFHVLGLLSDMGDRYWVLPEQKTGGHKVSGFASRDDRGAVRILALFSSSRGHAVAVGRFVRRDARHGGAGLPGTGASRGIPVRPGSQLSLHAGAVAARSARDDGRRRPTSIGGRGSRPRRKRSRGAARGARVGSQARHRGPASRLTGHIETRRARTRS